MKLFFASFIAALFLITLQAQPPAGYYNGISNKYCDSLKSALKSIISTGVTPRSYSNLWAQYAITDIKPRTVDSGSANVIWDIYSSNSDSADPYQYTPITSQCGGYSGEGYCYNREHSVPLSWFSGNTSNNGPATDYNFIFPTDGYVNGKRSNFPYGEVVKATYISRNGSKLGQSGVAGISGTVFEPRDEFKGDVARAFLYFVTMYENNIPTWSSNVDAAQSFDNNTYPAVKLPFLQMMIKWHNQDPVSQKEIDRNNGAYSFQHNRNPFIDSPQLVDRIWNATCPSLSTLPVNQLLLTAKQKGSNVSLHWNVINELNLAGYEVQRSNDGTVFTSIASIRATGSASYTYSDITLNSGDLVYYRLKKIDKNNVGSYSEVVKIMLPVNRHISVYPNPAKDYINVLLNRFPSTLLSVSITDATGRLIYNTNYFNSNNEIRIPVNYLVNGNYILKATFGNESYSQKIVVAK